MTRNRSNDAPRRVRESVDDITYADLGRQQPDGSVGPFLAVEQPAGVWTHHRTVDYVLDRSAREAVEASARVKGLESRRARQARLWDEVEGLRSASPKRFESDSAAACELLRQHERGLDEWEHCPHVRTREGLFTVPDPVESSEMDAARESLRKRIATARRARRIT